MQLRYLQPSVNRVRLLFIFLSTFALTNCSLIGGSGIKRAKNVSFSAPEDWAETSSGGESDRAFKLKSGSTVTLTSSCQAPRSSSLERLTKDLLLGARKVHFIRQEKLIIANTQALFSHVNTTVDDQPFQLLFVVLKKNDCIFDFTLVSPRSITQSEIQEFLQFAKSFNYG